MSIFLVLVLILITFIAFVVGVIYLMIRWKRTMLCVCAGFVGIGLLIYTAAYLSFGAGAAHTLLAALRGIFSTARMFVLNEDHWILAGAQETAWLTENIWMQILLWLSHLSALIIIQTALIALFGRRLIDTFRLRFGLHREVYIIKGCDKNALMLGENIATRDAPQRRPDRKRLVLFLVDENEDMKKTYEKIAHFSGIVQVLDRNQTISSCLKKARLGTWSGRRKKYNVIVMSPSASVSDDARLIAEFAKEARINPESLDIFVFTSSEWSREKIEGITQEKEKGQRKYPYTFHIINEVELLARKMIEKHPPFECPGLGLTGGVAARDFTVMILGFGSVGQAAFLRLVMNGQFVGSRMRTIIVDKNIDDLRDCFLHRYPSLSLSCEMEFQNFDVQCDKFFKLLYETNHVDYVVVALDSDEINKQVAMDIRLYYGRKNLDALPFIAVSEKMGGLHEEKRDEKIFIFGCREEIYKEAVIIREETDLLGKAVHKVYGGDPPWHELEWLYQESNRAAADFIPAMLHLANVEKEDALHIDVLTKDDALTEVLAQTEKLRWNAFHTAMGYRPLSIEEMRRQFETYDGEPNARKLLDFSRRDSSARLHACLVPWDELDKVSEAYKDLAHRVGDVKEQTRDFKMNDRKVVSNIPQFLRAAKGES